MMGDSGNTIHSKGKEIITDEFMEWEERDTQKISLFKHCVAGKYFAKCIRKYIKDIISEPCKRQS